MLLLPGAEISGEDDGESGEAMELFPQRAEFNTAPEEARFRSFIHSPTHRSVLFNLVSLIILSVS